MRRSTFDSRRIGWRTRSTSSLQRYEIHKRIIQSPTSTLKSLSRAHQGIDNVGGRWRVGSHAAAASRPAWLFPIPHCETYALVPAVTRVLTHGSSVTAATGGVALLLLLAGCGGSSEAADLGKQVGGDCAKTGLMTFVADGDTVALFTCTVDGKEKCFGMRDGRTADLTGTLDTARELNVATITGTCP